MTRLRSVLAFMTGCILALALPTTGWSGPVPQVDPFGNPLPPTEQVRQQVERLLGQPVPSRLPVRSSPNLPPVAPFNGPDVPVAFTLSEAGVAVQALSADLAETPDVRFTPEILEVVQRFGGDPEKLYLYVKNGFDFTPYVGSQKGSQGTALEFSGNDVDQASLLIALLRAAGIPARYVTGSMYIPIDEALNWLGVDNPTVALQILQWQGIPAQLVNTGGGSLLVNRTWVEAFVVRNGPNPRWVPMDPAFKPYTVLPGSLMARQVPFSRSEYLSLPVAASRTAFELFREQVQAQLDATQPGTTVEDIARHRVVVQTTFPKGLPGRLENRARVAGEFSTLSDDQRYRVTLYTVDDYGVSAQTTLRLPEIYGRRLTVSFPPATVADDALVTQYGGYYNVPANLLTVRPTLKLDGQPVVQGSRSVGIGQGHYLVVDFLFPGVGLVDRIYHTVFAGGYYAVGLDTIGDAGSPLKDRGKQFIAAGGGYDDTGIGEWLSLAALDYLNNVEQQMVQLGALLSNVQVKDVAEALTSQDIRLEFDASGVLHFRPIGWTVDAKRVIARHFAVDGDESDLVKKFQILGLSGSALEHRLWEDFGATPSVSTVNGLQFANQTGIPVLTIDQGNIDILLPTLNVFPHVRQAVIDAVGAGRTIIIPHDTLFFDEWVGSVWIDDLPGGLSTGYLISGGLQGGANRTKPFKGTEPDCTALGNQLGEDKYKAVASTEGKIDPETGGPRWRQFDKEGSPLQGGNDFGTMQVNKNWAGNSQLDFQDANGNFVKDGKADTIDFEKVQKQWDYNVEVGKAIFDAGEARADRFFDQVASGNPGFSPTAEERAKESAFFYNHSPSFNKYTKDTNGKKVLDRVVPFHYYKPVLDSNGRLVKEDYSSPDFSEKQREGAEASQKYGDKYWGHFDKKTWTDPKTPPC